MYMIKEATIIILVLIYWKFVYYNHRTKNNAQFYVLIPAMIITLIGLYTYFFIGGVDFNIINVLFYINAIYLTMGFVFVYLACLKHKLKPKIDYTLSWIDKTLGRFFIYVAVVISYPAFFFMLIGTFSVFGKEHVYLWIMILWAWTVSQIRLFLRYVRK